MSTGGMKAGQAAPAVGVGVVVMRGEEVLLVKRGKPPRAGDWSLPGGRQELGETVRETALREVREETGLNVEITGFLDVIDSITPDSDGKGIAFHYTLIDFAAIWTGGEPVAGTDAADVGWFHRKDIAGLGLWSETRRIIELAFERAGG